MSFEINPVLAGKFDTPDYGAANSTSQINAAVTGGDTDQTKAIDSRRYTQFDRTITDAGTATMSFGDVLDMINPLEHIPVVSAVYRAIVGEEINPVSRVAGDVLYGGVFGIGSAVLGGMGAIADSELVQTTGKDSKGLALAALFGPDDDSDKKTIQLADASSKAPPTTPTALPAATASTAAEPTNPMAPKTQEIQIAQSLQPSSNTAALAIPDMAPTIHTENSPAPGTSTPAATIPDMAPPMTAQIADAASITNAAPPIPPKPDDASASTASLGAIPLLASTGNQPNAKPGKQAFGGVMAQPNAQAEDMAIALAQGSPSTKMGHMIYTNPLVNGRHPLPPMLSNTKQQAASQNATQTAGAGATPASLTSSKADSQALLNALAAESANAGGMSPIPNTRLSPELSQDMMLKALSQYRSMANSPNNTGSTFNLTN